MSLKMYFLLLSVVAVAANNEERHNSSLTLRTDTDAVLHEEAAPLHPTHASVGRDDVEAVVDEKMEVSYSDGAGVNTVIEESHQEIGAEVSPHDQKDMDLSPKDLEDSLAMGSSSDAEIDNHVYDPRGAEVKPAPVEPVATAVTAATDKPINDEKAASSSSNVAIVLALISTLLI